MKVKNQKEFKVEYRVEENLLQKSKLLPEPNVVITAHCNGYTVDVNRVVVLNKIEINDIGCLLINDLQPIIRKLQINCMMAYKRMINAERNSQQEEVFKMMPYAQA